MSSSENSSTGRQEAERCFRAVNHTEFFTYDMTMQLCLPRPAQAAGIGREKPSPSPERSHQGVDCDTIDGKMKRLLGAAARRRRIWEEEKKQRAKNFDPVIEAVQRSFAES